MKWFSKIQAFLAIILSLLLICPIGCKKEEPQSKEIKIGAVLPLTGSAAKYGNNAKKGIDLAVKKINSEGGVGSQRVTVIYEDSQGQPSIGVASSRKLISSGIPAVIGAMASSVTLAIAPVMEENHVVLISPASSNPKITEAGDYIFRNCVSDLYEGTYVAKVAAQRLNLKRIAVLYVNNDYGRGLMDVFSKYFPTFGGEIVQTESFELDAVDVRSQLTKIDSKKPDGIFLVGYKEMIIVLRQYAEMGMKCRILSTVMFDDPEIIEKVGKAAEGIVFSTWRLDKTRPEAIDFIESFKKEYSEEPGIFSPESYDALLLLCEAIKRGGFSPEGIKSALYGISDFHGVSGETSFDKNGDVIKPLVMMVVKDGAFDRFEP